MDFRKVTPDSINYLKTVSITEQARLYVKLTKLHRLAVQNVWFNQQCKHFKVIPNYIHIRSNTHSRAANIALRKAENIWLNEESRHWFTVRDNLKLHLKILYSELSFSLHNIEFDLLDNKARDFASIESHKKYLIQQRKLQVLIENASRSNNNRNEQVNSLHTFYPRVKNLTNIQFPKAEMSLLEKGLKYNLSPNINNKNVETLAVDAEVALVMSKKDNIVKSLVAQEIKNTPLSRSINLELPVLKSLKNRIEDNNLVISKADKGNAIVVLDLDEYKNKVNDVICGDDFTQLSVDPTNKFSAEVRRQVNNSKYLFPTTTSRQKLIEMNPRAPKLYGLPKIHKDGIPIRPVVSYIGAPAYTMSKSLNNIIKDKSKFRPSYSLKNSMQLVTKIKDLVLPTQAKLLSLDVDSLFTNVPSEECLTILNNMLEQRRLHTGEISEIVDFTRTCMKQNYFGFNSEIYIQKEGLAMGSPLSPLMAEIFMDNFETQHIIKNKNILYYFRYVDDIIICWTGTKRQLEVFVKDLNKKHPKIKFKLEWEVNNTINFLDLTISRIDNKHHFEIFRKPTYTDTVIPASSCHPWQHKLAAFHSYIHRLMTVPLNENSYKKELNIIYQMAVANGYNCDIINGIIKKKLRSKSSQMLYAVPSDSNNQYRSSLTYIGQPSERIAKTLRKNNVQVAFRTRNKLRNICNGKDKLDDKNKSGVYRLDCSECNAKYVGQTGRSFVSRYKEHISAFRNNHPEKSHFAQHLLETGHNIDGNHSFEILHTCDKGLRLSVLERLEIIKHSSGQLLNEQINISNSPLLDIFNGITENNN